MFTRKPSPAVRAAAERALEVAAETGNEAFTYDWDTRGLFRKRRQFVQVTVQPDGAVAVVDCERSGKPLPAKRPKLRF